MPITLAVFFFYILSSGFIFYGKLSSDWLWCLTFDAEVWTMVLSYCCHKSSSNLQTVDLSLRQVWLDFAICRHIPYKSYHWYAFTIYYRNAASRKKIHQHLGSTGWYLLSQSNMWNFWPLLKVKSTMSTKPWNSILKCMRVFSNEQTLPENYLQKSTRCTNFIACKIWLYLID